ncbi:MAG: MFS transporter [Syntrophomonadaceae bacterium]
MQDIQNREKIALLVVMATSFITPFSGSAINLALPTIGKELNAGALMVSWVVTSFLLTSAAFLLPLGRIADIIGRRRIYLGGIILFALTSFFCSLAQSIYWLIAFRTLNGIASAMIFGTGMAILTAVYPPQKRGSALGWSVFSTYTGLSLGPVLGGFLNHYLGWRSIFILISLIAAAAAVITAWKLVGEWVGAAGERFDWAGSSLYVLGLLAFLYGLSSIADSPWSKYIALAGAVLIILFGLFELRQKYPVIQLQMFVHNSGFTYSNLAAMINYSATFSISFIMSLYLQIVLGFNSSTAGLILLSQPVVMAIFSPLAGILSDRIEPRIVASTGMALNSLGLFFFIFLTQNTPLYLIIVNLLIIGLGFALFTSPNSNAIMSSVEKRYYGIASSAMGTMRLVGQAFSMAIVTLIMSIFIGHVKLTPASAGMFIQSSRVAFTVFTVLCIIGIFTSLARGNIHSHSPEKQGA